MTTVTARLYDASSALLGELPNFSDVSVQAKLNDESAWTMKYDRSGVNAGLLIQDQDLSVKFYVDGLPVWEGLIEEDNWDEVSDSDPVTLAGRSLAGMFEFAKVYPRTGLGTTTTAAYEFVTATPGKIFRTLFLAAQSRGALPGFTVGFTDTLDSSNLPWANTLSITYKAGVSLLDILKNFGASSLADWTMNSRQLTMYNPRTTLGAQTNTIFRRGRDITSAPRSRTRRDLGTVYLVQGDNDVTVERVDATAVSARGRREQFLSQGGVTDTGTLNVIGDLKLSVFKDNRVSKTHNLVFSSEPDIYAAQPKPWTDYNPGAYVNTDLVGTVENYRLVSMTINMGTDAFLSGEVVLNDIFAEREILVDDAITLISGGSTGGGASTGTTTTTDKTIPAQVTGLNATSGIYFYGLEGNKYAAVAATWAGTALNTDGSTFTDFDRYEFRWWYDSDPTQYHTLSETDTFANFSGLYPGEHISFKIRAWDSNGHAGAFSSTFAHTLAGDTTPPPVPSTPTAANYLGLVRVTWNGLDNGGAAMPADFKNVEVWYSTVNNFTPGAGSTFLYDYLPAKGSVDISGLTYGTTYYTKLVSVDLVGNRSVASVQASAVPTQVVQTDIGGNVIDFSNIRFKDVGNLVPDGSFELSTTAALINATTSTYNVAVVVNPDGATAAPSPNVLVAQYPGSASSYAVTSGINVSPGQKVTMIYSHKSQNVAGSDTVVLQVMWTLANGTTSFTVFKTWNSTTNNATWTLREAVTQTVPANAVKMDILVKSSLLTATTAKVWIDQWETRFQIGTILIEDAAITNAKIGSLAVNDANIANMNVGKLVAGTLSADITVSARIKTANSGARVELSSAGLLQYNSSGTQTVNISNTGAVDITGTFRSGTAGSRIEINPSGLPTIRFYPTTGTDFGFINAFSIGSSDVGVGFNSSPYVNGSDTLVSRLVAWAGSADISIINSATQVQNGGHVTVDPGSVLAELKTTSGTVYGRLYLDNSSAQVGYRFSTSAVQSFVMNTDTWHRGTWPNFIDDGQYQGIFTGFITFNFGTTGSTAITVSYGTTRASGSLPVVTFQNATAFRHGQITASSASAFTYKVETFGPDPTNTGTLFFWSYRV